MATVRGFFHELKRRNVPRAAVLYAGAVWAFGQGLSQFSPALGLPDYATRWFLIAAAIGFPFWIAFAWFYEWTPQGLKRESEIAADASITRSTSRKLDHAIIAVLALAVVLLASGYFIHSKAPAENVIPAKSIAVLPFENLSADKSNAYFADGMQDLILTKLADIGDLKVISRTSTMQYGSHPQNLKVIAQQLGVATILEGSVQKSGNQVLINVQLIDAATDAHLWAQSYTRTLDNVFGVEGEVSEQIAAQLNAKLSPAQARQLAAAPTTNPAAYDAFLRAEYQANKAHINYDTADWKAAIALYRQAVAEDPKFALAFARLSWAESRLAWYGGGGEDGAQLNRQARADAETALKLQPGLPAAQLALGYCDYYGNKDYPAALKAFAAVLATRPNDADALAAQGFVQRRLGRFDDAIASLTKAVSLDPRNFEPTFEVGETCLMAGRYADAESWLQRALALQPDSIAAKFTYSSAILYGSGDLPRALAAVQGEDPALKFQRSVLLAYQRKFPEAIALLQSIPDTPDNFRPGDSKSALLGGFYWFEGDRAIARAWFAKALPEDHAALAKVRGQQLANVWNSMGTDEIGIGHVPEGLAAIAKAEALLDATPDAVSNPGSRLSDAESYALAGRADLAVPLLARALAMPGISRFYSPVMLWLDPNWDSIRKDPRFQALLEKYAKDKPAVTYDSPPAS